MSDGPNAKYLSLLRGNAMDEEPRVRHSCNMGVGCEEYGICFASATGRPDMCGSNGDNVVTKRECVHGIDLRTCRDPDCCKLDMRLPSVGRGTDMTDETKGDGMTLDVLVAKWRAKGDKAREKLHMSMDFDLDECADDLQAYIDAHLADQSAMRVDELLDASEALVLALGKRGIHISFYNAKAALQAAIGKPQP